MTVFSFSALSLNRISRRKKNTYIFFYEHKSKKMFFFYILKKKKTLCLQSGKNFVIIF